MTEDKAVVSPMKDKPRPEKRDGGLAKWLEDRLGFRPFGVEW